MSQRIEKYGQFVATAAENIAYGTTGGEAIIIQLVIDDGVANRGHRTNIFNDALKVLGSNTGVHGKYDSMTTIAYAGGLTSNGNYPLTPNTEPQCTHADQGTCSSDIKCFWDGSACSKDMCKDHLSDLPCNNEAKCFWSSSDTKCIPDLCSIHGANQCSSEVKCLWSDNKCSTDACSNHGTESPCSSDVTCLWSTQNS